MAAAEWRRPGACIAAVKRSSSRQLSCKEATSFSASFGTRQRVGEDVVMAMGQR